jgi:hypothetical protein
MLLMISLGLEGSFRPRGRPKKVEAKEKEK